MWIWENTKWPKFCWDEALLQTALFKAKLKAEQFLAKMRFISKSHQLEAEAEILTEGSINTALIEGEVLSRESVRSSVLYHLGIEAQDILERHVDGLVQILIDARRSFVPSLSAERLWSWHAALFPTGYSNLSKISVDAYRQDQVQIVSGKYDQIKVHFEAPPAAKLSQEMAVFINCFNKDSLSLDSLIRAALAHLYFEIIHPFDDGNGRLGRAIIDLALAQFAQQPTQFYSIATTIEKQRRTYYAILEKTTNQPSLEVTEFLLWFLELFAESIEKSELIISKILRKAHFWQTHAETELNAKQRKVLSKMLDQNKYLEGMTISLNMNLHGEQINLLK